MGDVAEAKRLEALSDETGTSGATHEGRHLAIKAGIAALEKRPSEALSLYRQALVDLDRSHSVWDIALVGLDMVQFLDQGDPELAAAEAASREIMERVGATPTLRMMDAAVGRTRQPETHLSPTPSPHAEVAAANP
jgi:hypothetical protein